MAQKLSAHAAHQQAAQCSQRCKHAQQTACARLTSSSAWHPQAHPEERPAGWLEQQTSPYPGLLSLMHKCVCQPDLPITAWTTRSPPGTLARLQDLLQATLGPQISVGSAFSQHQLCQVASSCNGGIIDATPLSLCWFLGCQIWHGTAPQAVMDTACNYAGRTFCRYSKHPDCVWAAVPNSSTQHTWPVIIIIRHLAGCHIACDIMT